MPTLVLGLNQCILLSLAKVVLAGLVGAGGLGAEVTRGLTRMEMGLGLRAGLAIVASRSCSTGCLARPCSVGRARRPRLRKAVDAAGAVAPVAPEFEGTEKWPI